MPKSNKCDTILTHLKGEEKKVRTLVWTGRRDLISQPHARPLNYNRKGIPKVGNKQRHEQGKVLTSVENSSITGFSIFMQNALQQESQCFCSSMSAEELMADHM